MKNCIALGTCIETMFGQSGLVIGMASIPSSNEIKEMRFKPLNQKETAWVKIYQTDNGATIFIPFCNIANMRKPTNEEVNKCYMKCNILQKRELEIIFDFL